MPRQTRGARGTDPILLLEAALVLVLFGLFVYFFLLPAADPPFAPRWWVWPLVAAVFFTTVALDAWRRRRAQSRERQSFRGGPSVPDEPVPPTG